MFRFRIMHLIWATAIAAVLVRVYVFSPLLIFGLVVVFGLNGLWLPILIAGLSFFANGNPIDAQTDETSLNKEHFTQQKLIRWLVHGWILSVLVLILFFLFLMLEL